MDPTSQPSEVSGHRSEALLSFVLPPPCTERVVKFKDDTDIQLPAEAMIVEQLIEVCYNKI